MAVTGMPSLGGEVAGPPTLEGVYRAQISDAQWQETKAGDRQMLVAQLQGFSDPDHPNKEGKDLVKLYGTAPNEADAHDDENPLKAKQMLGSIKRTFFDGFGVVWPEKAKGFDPRTLIGKSGYVVLVPGEPNEQGQTFPQAKLTTQDKEKAVAYYSKIRTTAASSAVASNSAAGSAKPAAVRARR